MEAFDITFFFPKHAYHEGCTKVINKHFLLANELYNNQIVEFFDYEDKSFAEFRISLFDFNIKQTNFINTFRIMSQYISSIMQEMKDIIFVTGIYELTYYLTEKKMHLFEFDKDFMKKFPIVFFRKGQDFIQGKVIYDDEYIICIFYEEAQSIW